MILTVTPNTALDVTYEVDTLVAHTSHRVRAVVEVAGGKGLNVASVLHHRGVDVVATGFAGGPTGDRLRADLDRRGIPHDLVQRSAETRRTVTVVSMQEGEATAFNEPGPPLLPSEWAALVTRTAHLAQQIGPEVVVASGSVPPGFPSDGYAQLTAVARAAGARVVIDASGAALLGGLSAAPDLVKPNRAELLEVTGVADPLSGAKALQDLGARDVVVSLGPDGLLFVGTDGTVCRAWLDARLPGNPTGAGDAVVAAVAAGLAASRGWEVVLRDAVACSAAAVLQRVAGSVDPVVVGELAARVLLDMQAGSG